jgi:hypothetical protein
MIKQPTQPLKFFASYLEVEKNYKKRDNGNPGTHIITEDILFIPPFQIKLDSRHEDINDFTFELIDYSDGTITDITTRIRAAGVFSYDDYQNLVCYRNPLTQLNATALYYLKIYDSYEAWYSEVFQLCDLNRNLLRGWTMSGWDWDSDVNSLSTTDCWVFLICKQGAGNPYVLSDPFYVTYNEPLDLYLRSVNADGGICSATTFLTMYFVLHDGAGNVISNVVTGIEGVMKDRLIPTKTCEAYLYCYSANADTGQGTWEVYLMYANPMLYDGSYLDNAGTRKVLRWSHSCNVCDMIYDQQDGYITISGTNYYWIMTYENYLIFDDPPLIPDFAIIETVSENDKGDKFLLLGAQQEWYYLQLGTSENLAKAFQFIHLTDNVEIDYNGEAHTICENSSEISYSDDNNFITRFRFREESCPVQNCCFVVCCPNLLNVYAVDESAPLPTCNAGTKNVRYLLITEGHTSLWECDGSSWDHMTAEEHDDACLYVENYLATDWGCHYWWWNGTDWALFAYLGSVTDNADGTATLNILDGSLPGLYVQAQYYDSGEYINCGSPYELTGTSDSIVCNCGAGTNKVFRLLIYTARTLTASTIICNYGYSNFKVKTIT